MGLFQRRGDVRSVWRLLLYAAILVGFFYAVALPLWDACFSSGGAFNQPLR